jgi:aminomethyltransferase
MNKSVYKYDQEKRAEHLAVRNTVGWYYFTHFLVEVKGPDAAAFLDWVYANPIANLKTGRARYTTMLHEDGLIWDDVVVFRLTKDVFWVSTLYLKRLIPWFEAHRGNYAVEYRDITSEWHMYSVQGPKSADVVNALVDSAIDDMGFFEIRDNKIDGASVKIARAGFTGEDIGYEIYTGPEHFKNLSKKLKGEAGKRGGQEVREFQVMVWTLPTERGYNLMGDIGRLTPFEADMADGIDWNRDFIGKDALQELRSELPRRKIFGCIFDDDDIHVEDRAKGGAGSLVYLDGEEVGRVAKVTYGYVCDKTIGYVIVDRAKVRLGDRILMNGFWGTVTEKVFV